MNPARALIAFVVIAAALALRIPNLALRPLHNDEAVNATKAAELWEKGRYKYDPDEYHGPTLHYATVPFFALSGAKNANELNDAWLRAAPVFFGVGLIFLLPLFSGAFNRRALVWAALFVAISPAMVFYSRYFIHEMLLVFFTALTLGAGWRYTQHKSPLWAAVTGAGLGLMFATKETFVLTAFAMFCAAAITYWRVGRAVPCAPLLRSHVPNISIALAAAAAIWLLFFSSFFTNFPGLLDSIRTYFPWLKRAGGHSPHIQPWYFYLERLFWFHAPKGPVWSEGLILILAVIGAGISFRRKDSPFAIFLTLYTVILMGVYTAISYKTPWCFLSFFLGMILLAGIGASAVVERFKLPAAMAVLALTAQLAWQSWRANFVYAADSRNPYVYAQTSPDVMNLVERVQSIGRMAPDRFDTIVKVIGDQGDYWPLPWYLRRFKNVGWYEKLPDDPYAPMIIASASLDAKLDEKSDKRWVMVGYTELRPKIFLELYVELELWKKYVEALPPAKTSD